jgi:hypothetical protein
VTQLARWGRKTLTNTNSVARGRYEAVRPCQPWLPKFMLLPERASGGVG